MARQRKVNNAKDIKLRQPDRSGPTEKTLLQIAEERNLFSMADQQQRKNQGSEDETGQEAKGGDEESGQLSPAADRFMETILYAVCLAMLHFTLDYLVQHQYAMEIEMDTIVKRTLQALLGLLRPHMIPFHRIRVSDLILCAVFAVLVHVLHPHPANTTFIPGLPKRYHNPMRQAIFFVTSIASGCYLIHITNKYTYIAVLGQSPPLGCLWIWSVLEMNLGPSVLSLAGTFLFFWAKGYKF